jgi:F-type H+-transporting ATPase subunit b
VNTVTLQIIGNLVNFVLFLAVVVKFAGPAVKKTLKERHDATVTAIRAAEEAKAAAHAALEATNARLAGSEAEFANLVAQAKEVALAQGKALEEAAHAEAERLKAAARAEIERERQMAVNEIREAVMRQAFERATAELQQQMNADRQRELVNGMIQKVGDGSLALK